MDVGCLNHLISIRREIHEKPELGYQETNTSTIIRKELDKINVSYERNIAQTGIIATMSKGIQNGVTILLRADMDASPMQEETGLPFQSKIPNKMHACGHDLHTTMLLGAASILKEIDFNGTVNFFFNRQKKVIGTTHLQNKMKEKNQAQKEFQRVNHF